MATIELAYFPDKFLTTDFLHRTDEQKLYRNSGTFDTPVWSEFGPTEPAGIIKMFAGLDANIPTGYLKCDGQGLSTTTYAALFAAIGYTWGGSGGTFNLPDFVTNNIFPRAAANDGEVGQSGGEDTHTLTTNEMPSHNHPGSTTNALASLAQPTYAIPGGPSNGFTGATVTVAAQGGGAAHENKPPYKNVYMIIKT